jgi:glutamate/tyrosine decarboxylase-like PLP-dependent enzyme
MNPIDVSPEEFRRLAERISNLAANYLAEADSKPIAPSVSGEQSQAAFYKALPERGLGDDALNELEEVIRFGRVQNGRFFGYVLGSGDPVAAAADLLASVLNQNVTAWRSSPGAVTIEQTVIAWLAQATGCPGFRGYLTGGGSSANLMGLAMAREAKAPANERGCVGRALVYASTEVHMSIPKSVALLGIGRENLRLIGTDSSFRMNAEELQAQIVRDRTAGYTPVAVVACAGTVNTGAIDPLVRIAEIARHHGAWLHIDGAYGALAAIAEPGKFEGLDMADSVSLDPHKWLYQPLDCGCLLYRSAEAAHKAFAHSGDYAKALTEDPVEGFAFFEESLELSRRFRALKLWLSMRYHGLASFRESIAKDLGHARRLADLIQKESSLELVAAGELSAVCFRYRREGISETELNQWNAAILVRTLKRGKIYLSNGTLRGKFCLRACIVNHRTTDADIDSIVPEVLAAAKEVAGAA